MERIEIQGNTEGGGQVLAGKSRGCAPGLSLPVREICTLYKEGATRFGSFNSEGVMLHDRMERYKLQSPIGRGGQGWVFRAHDCVRNIPVAVKEIYIPGKKVGESTINREISSLKEMRHQNVVRLLDVIRKEDKVNLIFEHTDLVLEKFMKIEPLVKHGRVSDQIKVFLHQILSGIAYCHSHNFIHGNLNPKNLLIKNGSNELMIGVFGATTPFEILQATISIATFFYMAPELIIGSNQLSAAVDVWSVGCVFAEMVIQKPLFEVSSLMGIIDKIFSIVGTPTEERWPGWTSLCGFAHPIPQQEPKNLADFVPGLEEAGIDLLTRMLCLNPSGRITAYEALQHEYFHVESLTTFKSIS